MLKVSVLKVSVLKVSVLKVSVLKVSVLKVSAGGAEDVDVRVALCLTVASVLVVSVPGCGLGEPRTAASALLEPPARAEPRAANRHARPVALVYRGPAGCEGCSEPVAAMLRTSRYRFDVRYVGPGERLPLTAASFKGVALYAQPGGDTSTEAAYRSLGTGGRRAIARFVRSGGRYLGICQGAYLAGSDPGIGLLSPGNTGWYIATKGAATRSARDAVIPVRWGSRTYRMYFQDGPFMTASAVPGERILARYTNGRIAALVRPVLAGRVGVVGPHPEAPNSWYREAGLTGRDPDGLDLRLGHRLIDRIME